MKHQNDDKPQAVKPETSDEDTELDDQELESVSGGVGSSSSPFRKQGKAGGPVVHALGPKQDDPSPGGGRD